MRLSPDRIAQFERDGYLVFPGLLSANEVGLLKDELARVGGVDDPRIVRERTGGGARIVYGLHEADGPTASAAYEALVRAPRLLEPVQDLLGGDVYVYHTKANTKAALEGAIYEWHQDYTNWKIMDGTPSPRILTSMVLLDRATEVGGCLYVIPGSHRLGIVPPDLPDAEIPAAIQRVVDHGEPMSVPHSRMPGIVAEFGEPVALTGEPGTVIIFHGDMVHGSGHNMSVHTRWILYVVYSAIDNRPQAVARPRANYKASRTAAAARPLPEGPLSRAMAALGSAP